MGNSVYDVTNFMHPGGMPVIDQVVGREIGRFMYGGYSIETLDMESHEHS